MLLNPSNTKKCVFSLCWLVIFFHSQVIGQDSSSSAYSQYGHRSNWQSSLPIPVNSSLAVAWNTKIGEGRSQVVGDENHLFVVTGTAKKVGKETQLSTRIANMQLNDGRERWFFETDSLMFDEQETFSGATASPQATPILIGSNLISISFTGQLICLDRNNGTLVWQKDLVKEFGAKPVQFGFSSSPVFDPSTPDRFCIMAAGKKAGFLCLNIADGSPIWKSECETCSYATPVVANFGGVEQWVLVSENEVFGVEKLNGERLWEYNLPAGGLTNVPTPMTIDNSRLVISGQGCQGTRCIEVNRTEGGWDVSERWFARKVQLFYTNWAKLNDNVIIGCTDKYLAALDARTGEVLGRWRGFGNGNVAIAQENLLVMDGNGIINVLEPFPTSNRKAEGLQLVQKCKVLNARCWTPLSIIGTRVLIRGEDRLICLTTNKETGMKTLSNLVSESRSLAFKSAPASEETVDPVERIFATFQTKGQDAALKLYSKLRSEKQLDETAFITLAESANEQGLVEVAKLIIADAVKDFPDSKEIQVAAKSIRSIN